MILQGPLHFPTGAPSLAQRTPSPQAWQPGMPTGVDTGDRSQAGERGPQAWMAGSMNPGVYLWVSKWSFFPPTFLSL